MIYLPLSTRALGEYLSSGVIGVFSSSDPHPDMQNILFPNVIGYPEFPPIPFEVILQVEDSLKAYRGKKEKNVYSDTGSKLYKGPIPISKVQKITFQSENSMKQFRNAYSAFPDVAVDLFELDVETSTSPVETSVSPVEPDLLSNITSSDVSLTPKTEYNRFEVGEVCPFPKKMLHTPSVASMFIGYAKTISLLATPDIEQQNEYGLKSQFELQSSLLDSLVEYVGEAIAPSSSVNLLIAEYFKAIEDGNINHISKGATIVSVIKKRLSTTKKSSSTKSENVLSFLNSLEETLLGFKDSPVMADQPNTILQRAFYLSCIVDSFEDLDSLRPQKKVGRITNAFAHYFLCCRQTFSFTIEDVWRKNRKNLDRLLEASISLYNAKSISLKIETEWGEDFDGRQTITINGSQFYDRQAQPDPEKAHIITSLKRLGYTPKRSRVYNGRIQVDISVEDTDSTPVFFSVHKAMSHDVQYAVKITAYSDKELSSFLSSKDLERLLGISDKFGVSLNSDSGVICVSRFQLIDTMDKDEVSNHLFSVACAAKAISCGMSEFSVGESL